jgi:hypothetical protein
VAGVLELAVESAVLAPSSHNTQPWLFRLGVDTVDLLADRRRQLPVVDPDGRELVLSCGAALLNLELALAHHGRAARVELLPDPAETDLLARVRLDTAREPTEAEEALFAAIPRRRTNRRAFSREPVPSNTVLLAGGAARAEGAAFVPVAEEARAGIADLVAEGDRRQYADRRFRRELAAWCTPNWSRRRDGLPGYALGLGTAGSLLAPLALRAFDLGRSQAAKSRGLALAAPVLALVTTDGDTTRDRLRAGRALQRVLLELTAAGVSASFLNQPVEVPELRAELGRVAGAGGVPQLLLRVGYGPEARATPRRPADDVQLPCG